jgi:hypothetical protein
VAGSDDKAADVDAINRTLRDIERISDPATVKALKGVLQRQLVLFKRLDALESRLVRPRPRGEAMPAD